MYFHFSFSLRNLILQKKHSQVNEKSDYQIYEMGEK